jgi:SHS2 domain-containing protein
VPRAHEAIPHTADVGIRAVGPDLPGLFEEAALAVAEVAADTGSALTDRRTTVEPIDLDGADLPALAFAWLNELIGLADLHGPLLTAEVRTVESAAEVGWRLRGRATFGSGTPRLDIKSATYHRLAVEPVDGGWQLVAYLDV